MSEEESIENYCDDGNSVEGDGCSSICEIEKGYVCTKGNSSAPSQCTKDEVVDEEVVEEVYEVETLAVRGTTTVQTTVGITVGGSASASSINPASSTLAFSILHQLKLLIMFLMIDTYIAKDVRTVIEGQDFALFTFDFMPSAKIPYLKDAIDWMDLEQRKQQLKELGLGSERSMINLLPTFSVLILLVLIHCLVKLTPS
jgi:cysteine-rich repeat protein